MIFNMKAKKHLGQHFLRSEKALRTIIETGDIKAGEMILEIGPGEGALTEKLLETGARVIAVEKDEVLFELLKQKFEKEISSGQLNLINDDILDFDIVKFIENSKLNPPAGGENYKLIANIPYNITGAILKKFLETDRQPEKMVLLVQKEVAQRIIARDGKESVLSISVKAYGSPRIIDKVLAGSFAPAPQVDSAILLIDAVSKEFFKKMSEKHFFQMLKAGFSSKRKKLSSNLSNILDKKRVDEAFQKIKLDENTRAEDLGIEKWQELAISLI